MPLSLVLKAGLDAQACTASPAAEIKAVKLLSCEAVRNKMLRPVRPCTDWARLSRPDRESLIEGIGHI
jgi:hypothetical protein